MSDVSTLLLLILPALVIVAGLKDVTTFTIPNWISMAAVLAFIPAALLMGASVATIGIHLGVGVLALFAGMAMWSVRWVGGGDAKLLAAAALWIGYPAVGMFLLITALAGGALALTLLNLRSGWARAVVPVGPRWMERLREQGGDVPYGLAICVGALAAFPGGDLVKLLIAQAFRAGDQVDVNYGAANFTVRPERAESEFVAGRRNRLACQVKESRR